MKGIIRIALAVSLASLATAQPHNHHAHHHRHVKRNPAPALIEERDVVTVWVEGPVVTKYTLDGEEVSEEEAEKGMEEGYFKVIGESTPTYTPPPPSTSLAPTPTPSQGAQFKESKSSSSSATPTPSKAPASDYGAGAGIDAEFPSGTIPCTTFPSAFGALSIPWMGMGGWSGLQKVPNYKPGDSAIDYIVTGIGGDDCGPGTFCSYGCPIGYQKTQWPAAQGATLQSIGGLYCNAAGFLELTRPEHPTLCEKGAGGVFVQNDMDAESCVCRTDYPGTENMIIPLVATPGSKLALTNPYSPSYYVWNNMPTTAQYYVNKKGIPVEDACVWNSKVDPKGAGNWAPINVGVGKNSEGITYISIFPNKPTTDALLDFNIEITGDVTKKCTLINGVYSDGDPNGCTTAVSGSGVAIIRFYQ